MNISSPANCSSKVGCFQPPSMIIVPSRSPRVGCHTKIEDETETVPMPYFERQASHEMSDSVRSVSEKSDKLLRWLPMAESDHNCHCSVPRCPLRQASFYNHSDTGSYLSRSSAGTSNYSILSDIEQLTIEIDELLKDMKGGERWESSLGGASSLHTCRNRKQPRRGSRCSVDHQSIKSATLPRRPYRQNSFGGPEKRWSACTHEGSYNSLPQASSEGEMASSSVPARRSLPQMPRRQKSNVE
jgi:hypothetical protein